MSGREAGWITRAGRVKWAVLEARDKALRGRQTPLSQSQLGKLIGVSRSTISFWTDGGKTAEPRKNLDKLESYVGIRSGWLVDGENDPYSLEQPADTRGKQQPMTDRAFKERSLVLVEDVRYRLFSGGPLTPIEFERLEKEIADLMGSLPNRGHARRDG